MNGKTPISVLQELMAMRKLPLPTYTEEGLGVYFKCTVNAAGVTAVGCATTKKAAKHESAKNALAQLSVDLPNTPKMVILEKSTFVEQPQKNYVGELNEWASKHGYNYPVYTDCIVFNAAGTFFLKCSFLGKDVLGSGTNKKDAKQAAAKRMVEIIKSMDAKTFIHSDFQILQPKKRPFVENIEEIIDQYEKLAMKNPTTNFNNNNTKNNPLEAAPEINLSLEDSVEVLQAKLRQYGVTYKLEEFQRNPYIMHVKIGDWSFLGTGKTKQEATRSALLDVLEAKKNGLSLNDDLISFT